MHGWRVGTVTGINACLSFVVGVLGVRVEPQGLTTGRARCFQLMVGLRNGKTSQQMPTVGFVANPRKGNVMPENVQEAVRMHLDHGRACLNEDKYDDAIACCDKAIARDPDDATAYSLRGSACLHKGELDRAIFDCSGAIVLRPDDVVAYAARGCAYIEKGDVDRAIDDFDMAIELNPKWTKTYALLRGCAYNGKGEVDRAIADFRKVLEIDPSDQDAKDNLRRMGVMP